MALKKRYVSNISIYVYSEDDEKAKKQCREIEKKIDKLIHNACAKTEQLHEQPFGTISHRKVKL